MATFVLVHGARHAGWVWDPVRPGLEKAGHTVLTPDLPGYGDNQPPQGERVSIRTYAEYVAWFIERQPEPVILAGHSMGGIVVSQAAEYRPEKIKKLVYVCAFLLGDGESIVSRGGGRLQPRDDDELRKLFYEDCSEEVFRWARAQLVAPPAAGYPVAIHITGENYGRIPRYYIECRRDNAIPPERQKQMYTDTPCERVFAMDTGHMPMLARPDELAGHLLAIADS